MNSTFKPLTSLLIKPAGPDCNLACGYCFYADKSALFPETRTHRMSDETLARLINQALTQSAGTVSFGWQGGEPTLMGLEFFQRAVELQERHGGGRAANGLQTNGLLLDERWARFLARNRFLVGLSLDGPEHVHDRYRRTRAGHGSWSRVRDRARLLLDQGVPTNALVVVTDYSVKFPDEIYEFHRELGLNHMQYIPCVESGEGGPGAQNCPAEDFGGFLVRLFDRWRDDFRDGRPTTFIRFFDSVFYHYAGLTPPDCALQAECGNYLVVEHGGEVFSCDFFVGPEHRLGDLEHDLLVELQNSAAQREFGRRKARLAGECRECRWVGLCRGGCPKERLGAGSGRDRNYLCRSYQRFFAHADKYFSELARIWKRENPAGPALPAPAWSRPGRNDPCPCGSGQKYKRCCGARERERS